MKEIDILKKDGIGILPTDTLYGVVGSAFSKKAVERIYKIKGRDEKKPFIILISNTKDLEKFGIEIGKGPAKILKKFWPGKVSIILSVPKKYLRKFQYLHRGVNSLAFRFPNNKKLISILKKTGLLVAPSANPQGEKPATTITQAKKYFGDQVDFYIDGGKKVSKPSKIISLESGDLKVIRK